MGSHTIGYNLVTWPHLTAKEAGNVNQYAWEMRKGVLGEHVTVSAIIAFPLNNAFTLSMFSQFS